jgi:hypothetical protein
VPQARYLCDIRYAPIGVDSARRTTNRENRMSRRHFFSGKIQPAAANTRELAGTPSIVRTDP